MEHTWFRKVLCIIALAFFGQLYAGGNPRILFISSYSYSWGSVPYQLAGLNEALPASDGYILNYEFMDTKNTRYSAHYTEFYDSLKYKMDTRLPYDGLIVCDDAALHFAMDYRDKLFPDIPIVFSGIDDIEYGIEADKDPGVTGIIEQADYAKNLELAHRLQPKAKRVVLILDDAAGSDGIKQQIARSKAAFAPYEVEYLNSSVQSKEAFCARLEQLSSNDIVILLAMGKGPGDVLYSENERYAMLAQYCHVPLYRVSISNIEQEDFLGGYLVDHQACGKLAGDMMKQILSTGVIPELNMHTPSEYLFDYRTLKKFGIKEHTLPKGSVIILKPDSFLQDHAFQITSILLAMMLLITFIFSLRVLHGQRQLEEKNKELEKASNAKSEFLSRMSHDMRTPMNGILGLASLMMDKTDDPDLRRDISQVTMSGRYLLNLINDTLDMNKIEANRLELHLKPVDSTAVLKNILNNAKILASDKGVELKISIPPVPEGGWKPVMMDDSRLEQIILNLISNAVKFTPKGGHVELKMETLSVTANEIADRYTVTDDGIGMSEEFLQHLYEPFSQEARDNKNYQNGTGLGLSIVKSLVTLMGGTIAVKSKINQGTVFTIELRFQRCKTALKGKNGQAQENETFEILQGKHILFCEDHPLNAEITMRLLKKQGVIADHAENGKEGVEKFESSPLAYYDCILMDVRMPVMDGLSATKMIRDLPRADAKAVPIIAMTANAFDDDVEQCLASGMNAHVSKPVEPNKLFSVIASFLEKQ